MTAAPAPISDRLRDLDQALSEGRSHWQALDREIIAIKARMRSLRNAPLGRDDTETALKRALTESAAESLTTVAMAEQLDYIRRAADTELTKQPCALLAPVPPRPEEAARLLLAVMATPAALVKSLKPALDALDFSDAGPSLAERKPEIDHHEKTLADLEAEQNDIGAALTAAGIAVAGLRDAKDPKPGDQVKVSDHTGQRWIGTWDRFTAYAWRRAA
ncbi:MAG: hypothetical protein WBG92_12075 [Thiohalocapsa sp.]